MYARAAFARDLFYSMWQMSGGIALTVQAAVLQPYFSQPRFLKYHMGSTALATISPSAYG
jgi:hypothetical protein